MSAAQPISTIWNAGQVNRSPMLIVVGSLDYLKPLTEHLHELVPSARYEVIDGAARSAHFERFDAYRGIVEDFAAEL